ncbi:hypothetical protein RchiOBHm_Chr7g0202241 [Rosa chinensis]|uniref:Uncharacterized protein n=1 Tax=Rosa chinensis TaxID=74649 RepID=A0A2P6P853_ROSCH|nr:hypothetical protein RchiOBHm_Chr7g0202241 [Rosa chinensis]
MATKNKGTHDFNHSVYVNSSRLSLLCYLRHHGYAPFTQELMCSLDFQFSTIATLSVHHSRSFLP